MTNAGFASVILDVDSTVCGIEGIDWLAERRGKNVASQVRELTDRAMQGEIALDSVYGERLALVSPNREDIDELAEAYIGSVAPGAIAAVATLRKRGRRVVLISGGLREAILPLAEVLGVAYQDVHAVAMTFTDSRAYAAFDTTSPLATSTGKRNVVESIGLTRRVLAVGDGATDLAMRSAVDAFGAFTGFVRREPVVLGADMIFETFDQILECVLA